MTEQEERQLKALTLTIQNNRMLHLLLMNQAQMLHRLDLMEEEQTPHQTYRKMAKQTRNEVLAMIEDLLGEEVRQEVEIEELLRETGIDRPDGESPSDGRSAPPEGAG
jgi:exonuclease I